MGNETFYGDGLIINIDPVCSVTVFEWQRGWFDRDFEVLVV